MWRKQIGYKTSRAPARFRTDDFALKRIANNGDRKSGGALALLAVSAIALFASGGIVFKFSDIEFASASRSERSKQQQVETEFLLESNALQTVSLMEEPQKAGVEVQLVDSVFSSDNAESDNVESDELQLVNTKTVKHIISPGDTFSSIVKRYRLASDLGNSLNNALLKLSKGEQGISGKIYAGSELTFELAETRRLSELF